MDPAKASKAELLFNQAVNLAPAERSAFLIEACEDDADLREHLKELLAAEAEAGAFLPEEPAASPTTFEPREQPGDCIGRYKLLQQIGEGGCGVVYMAEQEEPVQRRVALKVIKLGMDTKSVIARFEAERQALAMMDHPNIARVLDAGATETGRPYFVMELVRGIKITDYCDENNLPTEGRLKLFVQVCQAVQHAHQKGIIHRDIKPSNILVTHHDGVPLTKVIDFGIAKATEGRLTDKTLFTAFQQFIGTPAYMSPEQAEMSALDIDTRTDVYSLGVLLYELLTGRTPFDANELIAAGIDEIRRRIREEEPSKPSTRLSTLIGAELTGVARQRGIDAPKLVNLVRGDLDWIVMKALEKDRTRRYESASAFASDIRRHLEQEIVEARPPSAGYRFRKVVRRNKGVFAGAAAVAAALIAGLIASLLLYERESFARQRAVAAEQAALFEVKKGQEVTKFLSEMLEGVGPSVALGRDTTILKEILEKAAKRIESELKDQPEIQAELRTTIGKVYHQLAEYPKAEGMHQKALGLRKSCFQGDHPAIAESLRELGRAQWEQGKAKLAEVNGRQALAMLRRKHGDWHIEVSKSLRSVAVMIQTRGLMDEAERMCREALAISLENEGADSESAADSWYALANVLRGQQDQQAAEYCRKSLALKRKLHGEIHPDVARGFEQLGNILGDADERLEEAFAAARSALKIRTQLYGSEHPAVAASVHNLAILYERADDLAEAERLLQTAIAMHKKFVGEEHPTVGLYLCNYADILQSKGDLAAAEAMYRESIAMQRKFLGEVYPNMGTALNNLALIQKARGHWMEAEATLRQSIRVTEPFIGVDHPEILTALGNLASVLQQKGDLDEAEATCRKGLDVLAKSSNATSRSSISLRLVLAAIAEDRGDSMGAEMIWGEAIRQARTLPLKTHEQRQDLVAPLANLGRSQQMRGALAEAERSLEEALSLAEIPPEMHNSIPIILESLGVIQAKRGEQEKALQMFDKALAARQTLYGQEHFEIVGSLQNIAYAHGSAGRPSDSEKYARAALEMGERLFPPGHPRLESLYSGLRGVLAGQDKWTEAAAIAAKDVAFMKKLKGQADPKIYDRLDILRRLLVKSGQYSAAESIYREAAAQQIELGRDQLDVEGELKSAEYAAQENWAAQTDHLASWFARSGDHIPAYQLATALIASGDQERYRKYYDELVRHFGESTKVIELERIGKVLLLLPGDEFLETATHMVQRGIDIEKAEWPLSYLYATRGLAAYRQSEFTNAVQWCEKVSPRVLDGAWNLSIPRDLILAMALHQLNRPVEAEAAFNRAQLRIKKDMPQPHQGVGAMAFSWQYMLICEILQKEAVSTLKIAR